MVTLNSSLNNALENNVKPIASESRYDLGSVDSKLAPELVKKALTVVDHTEDLFLDIDVKMIEGDQKILASASLALRVCLNKECQLSNENEELFRTNKAFNVDFFKENVIPYLQGKDNLKISSKNIHELIRIADYFVWDKLLNEITKNFDQFLDLLSKASKNKNDLHQDLLKVFMSIKSLEGKVVFIEKLKERKIDIKKFILPKYLTPLEFDDLRHKIFHEAFLDRLLEHRGTFQNLRKSLHELDWNSFIELLNLPSMYKNFVTDCLKKLSSLKKNDLESFKTSLISSFPNSEVEAEQTNKLKAHLEFVMESLKTSENAREYINHVFTPVQNLPNEIAQLKSKMTEIDAECSKVDKKHLLAVKIFQKIALTKLETIEKQLPSRSIRSIVVWTLRISLGISVILILIGICIGAPIYDASLPQKYLDFDKWQSIYNTKSILIQTAICTSLVTIPGLLGFALIIFEMFFYPRLKNKHLIKDVDFQKIRDSEESKEVANGST